MYGSVTFWSSVKLVMEIYGSVSEAGELGPTVITYLDAVLVEKSD